MVAYVVVIAIFLAAVYAFMDDPHWCSKDGRRFTCRVLPLPDGDPRVAMAREELAALRAAPMMLGAFGMIGRANQTRTRTNRWLECRATIDADDTFQLFIRRGFARRHLGPCRVLGQGDAQRRRVVFVVDGPPQMQLRIPANSSAVATLTALLTR